VSACLLLGAGLACNSDDLYFDATSSTGTGTTGTTGTAGTPTTGGSTSTGEPTTGIETTGGTSTSAGDETTEVPPEQTCRDVLMCVGECALTLDPACFQMCAEGLAPDEAAKAAQLGLCIGGSCFESGACSPDTLMDPKCLGCIAIGILSPSPPGCEEQAAACQ
jgi:hypothetical protein